MIMQKIMEKRRSVRDYKDKTLESADFKKLEAMLENMPQVIEGVRVEAHFVDDGHMFASQLQGKAGYHGVMIKAPHYVVLTCPENKSGIIASGYAGEWLVLNATKEDIGTCWVSVSDAIDEVKSFLNLNDNQYPVGIIALGYAKQEVRISNIYGNQDTGVSTLKQLGYPHIESEYVDAPQSGRMSIEDIVYMKTWGQKASIERLESLGYAEAFFYMRLAPSSANRQPWRFVIDRDDFVLAISKEDGYDDDRIAYLEAGIAMLYFEVAMHDEGYPGSWKFEAVENKYDIPDQYLLAGTYSFM